eukprot:6572883-Ditylum_brightwellii.AAC.1
MPPLGMPYADTLAQANALSLINYAILQGLKLWILTNEGLKDKFNCEEHRILLFLEDVEQKIAECSWDTPGADCVIIPDANSVLHNCICAFGYLTTEKIKIHAQLNLLDLTQRHQNNVQFYQYLTALVSKNAKIKILAKEEQFKINNIPIRALLFKLLMEKNIIDTVVTNNTYQTNLQELGTYMAQVNSNIDDFNQHVKQNLT